MSSYDEDSSDEITLAAMPLHDDLYHSVLKKSNSELKCCSSSFDGKTPIDEKETMDFASFSAVHELTKEELPIGLAQKDENELEGLSDSDYPDGGWEAWSVVLGAGCTLFCVLGMMAGYGAFNSYYQTSSLPISQSPTSAIAGVGSVQSFVCQFGVIAIGPIFDRTGPRPLMISGSVLFVAGLFATSFCRELWQFMLAQGITMGLGMSFIFVLPMTVVNTWFLKNRGLALGITIACPSLGAIVWPLMINSLPPIIGFGWTVRVIGFMSIFFLSVGCVLLRTRLPPTPRRTLFNLKSFKNLNYCILTFGSATFQFGYFYGLYFIQTYTRDKGFAHFAPYTVMLLNGCSGLGRILIGILADYTGRFNAISFFVTFAGVMMFIWIQCTTLPTIIVFTILYGFTAGAFASLQMACLAELCDDMRDLGTDVAQSICVGSFFLVGSPISGVILGSHPLQNFTKALIVNGICILITGFSFLAIRIRKQKHLPKGAWVL